MIALLVTLRDFFVAILISWLGLAAEPADKQVQQEPTQPQMASLAVFRWAKEPSRACSITPRFGTKQGARLSSRAFSDSRSRGARLTLVLAPIDQLIDDFRLCQGRRVAKVPEIIFRDLAQDPAHNLARPGLRKAWRKLDKVRAGNRPDL